MAPEPPPDPDKAASVGGLFHSHVADITGALICFQDGLCGL